MPATQSQFSDRLGLFVDSYGDSEPNVMDGGAPQAFLNADQRGGGAQSNGKPSLSVADAALQITRSNTSWGGVGNAVTISFAFRATAPTSMPSDTDGFTPFTQIQIEATLLALQAWSDVANIVFTRVGDYSDSATMLFGNYASGEAGAAGFAYGSGNRAATSNAGDVWVNSTLTNNVSPGLLSYGLQTLTHEIGHTMGLSHPAAYNAEDGVDITYGANATYYEDSRQYTVMSYFSQSNTGANFSGTRYSAVPLLDDIAAAQRLYGANMTTRTGDTVYGFNSTADRSWFSATSSTSALIFAIWDAGGADTLDFSGYSQSQTIDLRQGAFSSVGGLIGNVAIAMGTVIEQAIGGSGADTIYGNSGDNILTGGAGSDAIDGGAGTDTAVYAGASSGYSISTTNGLTTVANLSTGDRDALTNIERLQFSDRVVLLGAVAPPTPPTPPTPPAPAPFNPLTYGASNLDLALAFGADAAALTQHYVTHGVAEGRPTNTFNAALYAASNRDLALAFGADTDAATRHYLTNGLYEGRPLSGFNALLYAASSPDLAVAFGTDSQAALIHYLSNGLREGRSDNSFDARLYAATSLDLARIIGGDTQTALIHYLQNGAREGRPTSGFDAVAYLLTNPDLAGRTASLALDHWLSNGADEGRVGDARFGREQAAHGLTGTASARIDSVGDRDWFQISAVGGQRVTLNVQGVGAAAGTLSDGLVYVYDSLGRLIASDDDSGPGNDALISFIAPSAGAYYVVVAGFGSSTGTYRVTLATASSAPEADSQANVSADATVGAQVAVDHHDLSDDAFVLAGLESAPQAARLSADDLSFMPVAAFETAPHAAIFIFDDDLTDGLIASSMLAEDALAARLVHQHWSL